MARKPSDIVQPNLRIREDLRRRLEQEAKKRGVSLNYEMTLRLKESFDREAMFTLGTIASDMNTRFKRFDKAFHELEKQGDLLRAAEVLLAQIEQLPAEVLEREALVSAIAQVRKAIKLIDNEAMLAARRLRTAGAP